MLESAMTDNQLSRLKDLLALYTPGQPLSDAAYSALRHAITENVIPQASRLSGASLSVALGISRTPLRDALRRLEAEHLIASSPGSGFVVIPLSLKDIDEIYALRTALEGCAASLAARHRTSSDLSLLQAVQEAFAQAVAVGDADSAAHLNARFHDAINQAAKSTRLTDFLSLLQLSVRRLGPTTLTSPQRAQESVLEHAALLEAIRNADSDRSEAIARDHMEHAHAYRLEQYHLAFMTPPAAGAGDEIPEEPLPAPG